MAPLLASGLVLHVARVFIFKVLAKYIWIFGYSNSDLLRTHLTASLRNLYFTVIESRDALYIPQRGAIIKIKKLLFLHRLHTDRAMDPVVWRQITNEMLRLGNPTTGNPIFFSRNETLPY